MMPTSAAAKKKPAATRKTIATRAGVKQKPAAARKTIAKRAGVKKKPAATRKGKHRDGYKWVPSALAKGQSATWLLRRDKRRKRNPMSTCPVCGPPEVALRPYGMKSCGVLDLCPDQCSSCCRAWADSVVVYCPQCCARFCRQCVKKGYDMADGDSQDSEGNVKKFVRRAERGLDGSDTPTSP